MASSSAPGAASCASIRTASCWPAWTRSSCPPAAIAGWRGGACRGAQGVRRDRGSAVRLGRDRRRGGDWIKQASLYALLVRTTTTWDHDGDGQLRDGRWTESGTFLKTIMLLPMLRRMGCSALYLLPVTKVSRRFKKGELGCPYAARNLFELEPDLHDQLLGRSAEDVELEFAALVESAHALGMHVLVDLAPRTTARDSDLLLEHPEWFYWIDKRAERSFGPPPVESCSESMPTRAQLGAILREPAVQAHLARVPLGAQPDRPRALAGLRGALSAGTAAGCVGGARANVSADDRAGVFGLSERPAAAVVGRYILKALSRSSRGVGAALAGGRGAAALCVLPIRSRRVSFPVAGRTARCGSSWPACCRGISGSALTVPAWTWATRCRPSCRR